MRKYYVAWAGVSLAAATAETILELPTVANMEAELCELVIGFDMSSAGSALVEFGTYASAGSGGTAATPQKFLGDRTVDSAITGARYGDTTEPSTFTNGTAGSLYPSLRIPLPAYLPFQWPLQEGFTIGESTNFALRVTSSVAGTSNGWVAWKE